MMNPYGLRPHRQGVRRSGTQNRCLCQARAHRGRSYSIPLLDPETQLTPAVRIKVLVISLFIGHRSADKESSGSCSLFSADSVDKIDYLVGDKRFSGVARRLQQQLSCIPPQRNLNCVPIPSDSFPPTFVITEHMNGTNTRLCPASDTSTGS